MAGSACELAGSPVSRRSVAVSQRAAGWGLRANHHRGYGGSEARKKGHAWGYSLNRAVLGTLIVRLRGDRPKRLGRCARA